MTDHDDLLSELGDTLEIDASPEFAAGVHALLTESRRRTRQIQWTLAAAASIGIVSVFAWRSSTSPAVLAPVPQQHTAPASVAAVEPAVVATDQAKPNHRGAASAPQRVESTSASVDLPKDTSIASSEPRLEVITNQGDVLRALWASASHRGAALIADDHEILDHSTVKPIVVESIVVPSIVVVDIGKEPRRDDAPAGIGRIKPMTAGNATKEFK
jgi:hypothetical protein